MIAYLRQMAGTAQAVAGGDLTVQVSPRGELGQALSTELERLVGRFSL